MNEVEAKIIGINPEETRKKLLDLGAERIFNGKLEAKVFDFPGELLRKKGAHLRLRKAGDKVEIAYKEKKQSKEFKKREEIETHVKDFDKIMKILEKLGLKEFNKYEKTRESFRLQNIRFDIDVYPEETGIPPLVEVESTEEGVKKGVEMLGFQMKDTSTASAWSLLELYKK
jgi:predicted adenylyl cyclase CyaB